MNKASENNPPDTNEYINAFETGFTKLFSARLA